MLEPIQFHHRVRCQIETKMSEINSLLTSLGLSPENDSQFLTTSSFRRYTSNIKPTSNSIKPTSNSIKSTETTKKQTEKTVKVPRIKRKQEKTTVNRTKKRKKKNDIIEIVEQTTTKTPIRSVARYCPRMNDIKYSLSCEWKDCNLVLESMDAYLDHIDMHLVDDLKISQSKYKLL